MVGRVHSSTYVHTYVRMYIKKCFYKILPCQPFAHQIQIRFPFSFYICYIHNYTCVYSAQVLVDTFPKHFNDVYTENHLKATGTKKSYVCLYFKNSGLVPT